MIVLLGVFFLVNPFKLASVGNLSGIIVALIGGIFLSAWIITGRICGKRKIHPITIKFGQSIFMFLFLIISYPIMSFFVKDSSITSFSLNLNIKIWVYLLIFEIFSFITPHLFYFKGIQKVTASDAGVILLLEPVSGSILATLFLNQPLTLNIILGGLFILFSNYLVIRKK